MDNLRKGILIRNNVAVGAVGDKNFSTAPIGTVLAYIGQTAPRGYLLADGASYPTTEYPDLYAVIGNTYGGDSTNFNVPDYRETVLVGVGENTTDTIASHDVYELGEFKDDQLQGHEHSTYKNYEGGATGGAGSATNYGGVVSTLDIVSDGTNGEPRKGTTTHGKQKGVTYIIKAFHTNEGVDSTNEVSDPIIEYVEGEVATKQENIFKKHITSRKGDASDTKPYCLIATINVSNVTFISEPIIIEGVMGNATSSAQKMLFKASFDFRNGAKETAKVIYGYINQSSLFSHIDLLATFDESAEIAYIYVHHKTNYSIIDADISVPQRNASMYLTIPETFEKTDTIIGTEAHRMSTSTGVKVLAGLDDTTSSSESTWSSSKIASEINPTIDISKVFSNGALNIATLCSTYGNGRYVVVGQGTAGNGSATIDIWTLASHAISYIVNVTYSNKTSNTFIGLTYENPTVNFEANYLSACNHIAKVCTLA